MNLVRMLNNKVGESHEARGTMIYDLFGKESKNPSFLPLFANLSELTINYFVYFGKISAYFNSTSNGRGGTRFLATLFNSTNEGISLKKITFEKNLHDEGCRSVSIFLISKPITFENCTFVEFIPKKTL